MFSIICPKNTKGVPRLVELIIRCNLNENANRKYKIENNPSWSQKEGFRIFQYFKAKSLLQKDYKVIYGYLKELQNIIFNEKEGRIMGFLNNFLGGSQEERLIKAISDNNFDLVKELISERVNLNFLTQNGDNPLMKSMFSENREIFQLLIKSGSDVNFSTNNGYSPLIISCMQNDLDRVRLLLNKGANIHQKTKQGWTPLIMASENPIYASEDFDSFDFNKIESFLKNSNSNQDPTQNVLNNGIVERATLKTIISSRKYHTENDPSAIVKLLLSSGASSNEVSLELGGYTPLIAAATYSNYKTIQVLLENGSNVNYKDTYQQTALGYVKQGTVENYFKKIYNTDFVPFNVKEEMYTSPFTLKWIDAIRPKYEMYRERSVNLLIKNGADIHA